MSHAVNIAVAQSSLKRLGGPCMLLKVTEGNREFCPSKNNCDNKQTRSARNACESGLPYLMTRCFAHHVNQRETARPTETCLLYLSWRRKKSFVCISLVFSHVRLRAIRYCSALAPAFSSLLHCTLSHWGTHRTTACMLGWRKFARSDLLQNHTPHAAEKPRAGDGPSGQLCLIRPLSAHRGSEATHHLPRGPRSCCPGAKRRPRRRPS